MNLQAKSNRLSSLEDHAAVFSLQTASGGCVELMRTSYRAQVFPKHTHDYYTLGVVLHGVATFWHRGLERVARRDDVVVIAPGEVHTGRVAAEAGELSYLALHVPSELFACCGDAHGDPTEPSFRFAAAVIRDSVISTRMRRIDALMRPSRATSGGAFDLDADTPCRVSPLGEIVIDTIGMLVRRHAHGGRSGPALREPAVVRVARETIENCYMDNARTSLRALALCAGVSPFHLVRVFSDAVGLAPHQYLVQTRVRKASELLARGIAPSFVAAMTGFVDQSHLTTQFKRYVGTTPASYQQCVAPRHRGGHSTSRMPIAPF